MRKYHKFRYWKKRTCKAGENNPAAKITRSIVDYIRENYMPRVFTAKMLAGKFDLSEGYVRRILAGAYWPCDFGNVGKMKLTPGQESAILNLWNSTRHLPQRHPNKWSRRKLAKGFNVSGGLITHITSGKKISVRKAIGLI